MENYSAVALPSSMPTQQVRGLRRLGWAVISGMCLTTAVRGVAVWTDWLDYFAAAEVASLRGSAALRGQVGSVAQLLPVALVALSALLTIAMLAAWASRARRNAELISRRPHRLPRGWAVGAWFVPVANLWLPKLLVEDIWLASDPVSRTAPVGGNARAARAVTVWWVLVVTLAAVYMVGTTVIPTPIITYDYATGAVIGGVGEYRAATFWTAVLNTALLVLAIAALVPAWSVLDRIGRWQDELVGHVRSLPHPIPEPAVVQAPPRPERLRLVTALGYVAMALIAAWSGSAVGVWLTVRQVAEVVERTGYAGASMVSIIVGMIGTAATMAAAGVVWIVWLYRVRGNAQLMDPSVRMPRPMWAVIGWLIPFVNLVVPPFVVAPLFGRRAFAVTLVPAWWFTWIGGWAWSWAAVLGTFDATGSGVTITQIRAWSTYALECFLVSACLAVAIIAIVGRRQAVDPGEPGNGDAGERFGSASTRGPLHPK